MRNVKETVAGTDVMSPEGVEERVMFHLETTITLTQGGKYRVYFKREETNSNGKIFPSMTSHIADSIEEAKKMQTAALATVCMMEIDPKGTMEMFLSKLRKDK